MKTYTRQGKFGPELVSTLDETRDSDFVVMIQDSDGKMRRMTIAELNEQGVRRLEAATPRPIE